MPLDENGRTAILDLAARRSNKQNAVRYCSERQMKTDRKCYQSTSPGSSEKQELILSSFHAKWSPNPRRCMLWTFVCILQKIFLSCSTGMIITVCSDLSVGVNDSVPQGNLLINQVRQVIIKVILKIMFGITLLVYCKLT